MPFTNRFEKKLNIIVSTFEGRLNYKEFQAAVDEVCQFSIKHNTYRVLSDFSQLVQGSSIIEIYNLTKYYDAIHLDRSFKQAVVLPDSPRVQKDVRFYETSARNHGYNVQLFDTREKAIHWLME